MERQLTAHDNAGLLQHTTTGRSSWTTTDDDDDDAAAANHTRSSGLVHLVPG
jgi:hypothetical protein